MFKNAHAALDQGRGFEKRKGKEFAISFFGFFIPRSKGSGDMAMSLVSVRRLSIRPSELPSVNIFVYAQKLKYRLKYFDDTSQFCRTGHDDMSRTKMRALALIPLELSPL